VDISQAMNSGSDYQLLEAEVWKETSGMVKLVAVLLQLLVIPLYIGNNLQL
jgi:hypothetical protein